MLSKALIVGAYQRKLEELARIPAVELTAVVPPGWRDRRGDAVLERIHTAGYDLLVAPLLFNGYYHLHFYPTLERLLWRLRPDVVHVDEEPYNLATWHALRAAARVGAAGVFFTWQNLPRRYPWPFSAMEAANYRRARHAIAGNQAAAGVLRSKGYGGPLTVIPQFGVDPEVYCPEGEEGENREEGGEGGRLGVASPGSLALCSPALRIGYAGALIPEKGVDVLLRACAGLQCGEWTLRLIGDGPERALLGALAEQLGIASRVQFMGRQPSTAMPTLYRGLDVLVLPSLTRPNWAEQFGRVLVEAMACEVAVVGSSSGEIPNVIGEAGLICAEGDPSALRDALTTLAENATRRQDLARLGRARVLSRYTQAQVAAGTYAVYKQALEHEMHSREGADCDKCGYML